MYCHQNTFFHTMHWTNKYILVPSFYLNTRPPPTTTLNPLWWGKDTLPWHYWIMMNKVNILFRLLLKAPFPINLLVQPHSNSPKNLGQRYIRRMSGNCLSNQMVRHFPYAPHALKSSHSNNPIRPTHNTK